ncbi:2-oxoglutarate dehydrogenase E1 component [Taklimakanibacter deserti]|uniref:2-oxoglutarate dehydrogenase E1 component n=1 Tax=Taklimakanibacter deserti TaxID=2267839 RepID=UPI000E64790C
MTSVFSSVDAAYVENLERQFRADPSSVDWSWQVLFRAVEEAGASRQRDSSVAALIRERAHLIARASNPLNFSPNGNTARDLIGFRGSGPINLAEVERSLEQVYTGTLSVESAHIDDYGLREWVRQAFEGGRQTIEPQNRLRAFEMLIRAEEFERFLSIKHPTKKRFGAEGVEAALPLLDRILHRAAMAGVREVVIGSMHRGRLNIMTNVLGMPLPAMFALLKGRHPLPDAPRSQTADVPYHLGLSNDLVFGNASVRVTLMPNPSHLEAVNATVLGRTRATQDAAGDRSAVLGIILHTDASVVAQGVVAETVQLSGVDGFTTEGTIHIIVNNQIGFTTDQHEARTSRHCTGPWKAIDAMIVHVSADDVDAVLDAADKATAWRQTWKRDAVIDLVGYRRNGHNELDEPRFTQPRLYEHIDRHPDVSSIYAGQLIADGVIDQDAVAALRENAKTAFHDAYEAADRYELEDLQADSREKAGTRSGTDIGRITWLLEQLALIPEHMEPHPKVHRLVKQRLDAVRTGANWALGEALAIGSLLLDGINVRLTGQDVERGAFSHRHFAIHDIRSGARHVTLANLPDSLGRFHLFNSPLSEYAVLGFEYGYSVENSQTLVIWEAQFGDFANGAQIVLDQFIASGEAKWGLRSGLVILLPHGLEGQGPEHSSARPERILQVAAEGNIRIAQPSTPVNYFWLLREQAAFDAPVPLIILSPKTLLRLPAAVSAITEFAGDTRFQPVIASPVRSARAYLLCSGKIAYELEAELAARGLADVAVVRLEQIYPFPDAELRQAFHSCRGARFAWVQEEPGNAGLWSYLDRRLETVLRQAGAQHPTVVAFTRPESPSPAGSFYNDNGNDQAALIRRAVDWAQVGTRSNRAKP